MRFVLILLSVILVFQACSLDENTVAVVGDVSITRDEFKIYLGNRYDEKGSYKSISEKDKKTLLDHLILRKQKLNEAYNMGLENDQNIQIEYVSRKRQLLSNVYYEKTIVDEIVTDSLIKAEFEKTKYEVNTSHVLISFAGIKHSMNNRTKQEAYNLAKTINYKVRTGTNINAMAMEHSDDKTKMDNRGNLGYFVWGKMVDEFQEAAFNMEINEVSEPILSDFGYHVIFIHDKRENPKFSMDNLEKERDDIKKRIYYKYRNSVRPRWEQHLEDLKEKRNYRLLKQNVKQFVEKNITQEINDTLSVEAIKKNYGSLKLVEWDNGSCTSIDLVYNYLKRFNKTFSKFNRTLLDSIKVATDADQLASHIFIAQVSEEQGYLDKKDIRSQIDNFLEYSLITLVDKKSVTETIEITDEEMQIYYSENKSEFSIPEKMEMWEIYLTDEKKLNQVYGFAKSGRNFEQLANVFSEDKNYAKNYGRLGYRSVTSRGQVSRKAFEAGPNQILEPFKHRKGWVIVKTGDIKKNVIRDFEESKRQITNKIRTNKTKEKRETWEAYLKETYPADINIGLLAEI